MGQGGSSQSRQAGPADRQTRRHGTLWRRSTVPPSESLDNVDSVSQTRPSTGRHQPSARRLSSLWPTQNSQSDVNQDQRRSLRPGRLQRARDSVLLNTPSLFPHRERNATSPNLWPAATSTRERSASPPERDDISQPLARLADLNANLDAEIENYNSSINSGATLSNRPSSSRRSSVRLPNTLSERLSSFRAHRSGSGANPTSRSRRSPLRQGGEDNTALLSRLLSVAAAATAATLLEGNEQAISQARGTAVDGDDGSFDSFLQSLESGRLAAALRQGAQGGEDGSTGSRTPPLNFFRMFRFGAGASSAASHTAGATPQNNDGRMVPIIIVGIRAVIPGSVSEHGDSGVPPFLDALSTLPTMPSTTGNTNGQDSRVEAMSPQNGTRFSHRRRASMGGVSRFPSGYDNQRDLRSPDSMRPRSAASDATTWPRPPPATPASPSLSAVTSQNPTPTPTAPTSRRASFSSAPRRESIIRTTTTTTLETTSEDAPLRPRTARQRRLSDSDRRHSAYTSRRNGIVEPDSAPTESSRSWIIYVLGGSYPENHPILTTPSLFTDTPTYEDMMLLSAMLGPAKAPVASEKDVAVAGGLYKIEMVSDAAKTATLVAAAVEGDERVPIPHEERCLVCLCDFEKEEEVRKLNKCNHIFHKDCIDEWLTKGRNSCPLCRAEGVKEAEKKEEQNVPTDSAAPTPEIPSAPEVITA